MTPAAVIAAIVLAAVLVWQLTWQSFAWAPQWTGVMQSACEDEGGVTIESIDIDATKTDGNVGITATGTTTDGAAFTCFTNTAEPRGTVVHFELGD